MSKNILINDEGRTCTKCGIFRTWDFFYKQKGGARGKRAKCKLCSGFTGSHSPIYDDLGRVCRKCNKYKEWDKYSSHKKGFMGKNEVCTECCSKQCKQYYIDNSEKVKEQVRLYLSDPVIKERTRKRKKKTYLRDKEIISAKGKIYRNSLAPFSTYANKLLEDIENPSDDGYGNLEVSCYLCGQRFTPTTQDVKNRVSAINGNVSGEYHLYCSDVCKNSCTTYGNNVNRRNDPTLPAINTNSIPREFVHEFTEMILQEDNYECQICGSKKDLKVHHIISVKQSFMESCDIHNAITVCNTCHEKLHSYDNCSKYYLSTLNCEYLENIRYQAKNFIKIVNYWLETYKGEK